MRAYSLSFCLIFSVMSSAVAAERLNVLFIMADDLRDYGGVFTRELVKTPNLDRLRARGVTFERAYVQYPVCNPSRTSFLTGLRCEQTGVLDNTTHFRAKLPDVVTLPQLFKDAGWHTAGYGKIFHLGGGRKPGALERSMDHPKSWHDVRQGETTPAGKQLAMGRNVTAGALPWCQWGAAEGTDEDQADGQTATTTVAAIQRHTTAGQPWFIGCGFMKPHDPFIAPKKYFELYPPASLKPWQEPKATTPAARQAVGFGDYGKAFGTFTETEWRELLRAYLAGTSFMDAQLGRVLDALDQQNLWEKTLVLFIGDHGYHTGERNWWNKNTLFERSCRAPLVIAAPGIRGGRTSRSLAEFVDLYPTVADFCGLKMPHPAAGVSLRPVLENPQAQVKDAAFTLVTRGAGFHGQSVRTARWRFTRWSDGQTELYDHETDPEELRNVSANHPAVAAELTARLRTLPQLPAKP